MYWLTQLSDRFPPGLKLQSPFVSSTCWMCSSSGGRPYSLQFDWYFKCFPEFSPNSPFGSRCNDDCKSCFAISTIPSVLHHIITMRCTKTRFVVKWIWLLIYLSTKPPSNIPMALLPNDTYIHPGSLITYRIYRGQQVLGKLMMLQIYSALDNFGVSVYPTCD